MRYHNTIARLTAIAVVPLALLFGATTAFAHCDGLDGPVVKAARQALDTGNVNLVLIWVQKDDEAAIKNAFQKAAGIRKLSPAAKDMADNYFFETLVRVHRTGEGASYTGLKPAGRDLGPAIPAGDKALETGSVEPVVKLLTDAVQKGLREHFKVVMSKKTFNKDNVAAGREYIEAYVEYIHYVEGLYGATKDPAKGHYPESGAPTHKD
ncbi:MAG: DUF6448 family protein [Georgfuchsia sp.]